MWKKRIRHLKISRSPARNGTRELPPCGAVNFRHGTYGIKWHSNSLLQEFKGKSSWNGAEKYSLRLGNLLESVLEGKLHGRSSVTVTVKHEHRWIYLVSCYVSFPLKCTGLDGGLLQIRRAKQPRSPRNVSCLSISDYRYFARFVAFTSARQTPAELCLEYTPYSAVRDVAA
jgi:hypothetical protein